MESRKKIQFKPRLSIAKIGKFRFWTGIGLGVLSAIIFFFFISLSVECIDLSRVIVGSDIAPTSTATLFYEKFFLIALSVTFGNNTMLRWWFIRPSNYFKKTFKHTSARVVNYSLFIEYMVLYAAMFFISRFLLLDPDLNIKVFETFGYTFLLFPLYLFYVAWTEISRHLKTQRWMMYAFTVNIALIALVSFLDISQYKIGETAFKSYHYEELKYIDSEVEKAKSAYDVSFSEETIHDLKKLRTENAFNQLEKVRLAFKTDGKVSLDTIILEKILIHNFKGYYKDRQQTYAYTFPFRVYEQLRKVAPTSHEATELLNILVEFHELSIYMLSVQDVIKNISASHQNKIFVLSNDDRTLYHFGHSFNYDRMYEQTSFLLYHIQKLGTYKHHPLFDTELPFPPPVSYSRKQMSMPKPPPTSDYWIRKNFPEFYY